MTGHLAISIGDVTGIGPEVTLKALAEELPADDYRYLLLGDAHHLRRTNNRLGLQLDLRPQTGPGSENRLCVQHCPADPDERIPLPLNLPAGSPLAAFAALAALREGAARCLRHEVDGLVTAPVNKESIIRTGESFVGQTEFLSRLAGTDQTIMMLLGHDEHERWLRVALATTHLPLRRVADELTTPKIRLAIELAAQACRDLRLPRARVGVSGLNPHAGEGGQLGTEEITTIQPAVDAARADGLDVEGPLAADTLFYQAFQGQFDAVVAMYHDQGLAPLKMIGFDTGINWTLGLPFIRTSPDHGTAYNIAGKNKANPSSMRAAIRLAKELARRR